MSENADLRLSERGKKVLAQHEGVKLTPYNDVADNCTVGVGILLHPGPCSPDELKTSITATTAQQQFEERANEAARYVRHYVKDQKLTQEQFDSLVSFVYNVGVGNARPVLSTANAGKLNEVGQQIQQYHFISKKDKKTGKVTHETCKGLVERRAAEAGAFAHETKVVPTSSVMP
jgi:GH24 family phage-related lysozyme (muramidase)